MIHRFTARNYGCLRDVSVELTPLHAFIGPNDSGKSTLLNGLRTLVQCAGASFRRDERGELWPFDHFLAVPASLKAELEKGSYEIRPTGIDHFDEEIAWGGPITIAPNRSLVERGWLHKNGAWAVFLDEMRAVRLARLDPDALRAPSGLIPETAPVSFYDDRGLGLAGVYFALRNRTDDAFGEIVRDMRRLFPTIKGLRVKAVTRSEVVLEAELTSGAKIEAKRMSEGLLYYLAFAALRHLDPVSLLLIEEPENGLHPARIADVMGILREISKVTQVVLATHSPLVINELRPEEVSVVTRREEEGTKVTPIAKTHNFEKRSKVYALGELWLSYANGTDEEPLIEGRAEP